MVKSANFIMSSHDEYCWICHGYLTTDKIHCSTCWRSYNYACIKDEHRNQLDQNWTCGLCLELRNARSVKQNRSFNSSLLHVKLQKICNNNKFAKFNQYLKYPSDRIFEMMDLKVIKRKLAGNIYSVPQEFLNDIELIEHNCNILFIDDYWRFKDHSKDLVMACKTEIRQWKNCPECYARPNGCEQQHLLVWIKQKSFYWPAKVLSINIESEIISVFLFGSHKALDVEACECYLLTEKNPTKISNSKLYKDAMKECETYISNLSNFQYALSYSKVSLQYFDQQCHTMFSAQQIPRIILNRVETPSMSNDIEMNTEDEIETAVDVISNWADNIELDDEVEYQIPLNVPKRSTVIQLNPHIRSVFPQNRTNIPRYKAIEGIPRPLSSLNSIFNRFETVISENIACKQQILGLKREFINIQSEVEDVRKKNFKLKKELQRSKSRNE